MTLIGDVRAALAADPIFVEADRARGTIPNAGGGWYATYESVDEDRRVGVNVRLWACQVTLPNVEEIALGIAMRFRKVLRESLRCAVVGSVERATDENPTWLDLSGEGKRHMFVTFVTFDISIVGTPSGDGAN